jgi:phosphocarrier protein
MKVCKKFVLKNELGLHARAAAHMVKVSEKYKVRILIEKDGAKADGSSLLDILTLACPKGSDLTIQAEGTDAREAMRELQELIENKFGEM